MAQQVPPYRRIAEDVRRRIAAGELQPGDRVPSARQITKDWNVAVATATKALAELQRDGLTEARPGVGTVVAGPADARNSLPRSRHDRAGAASRLTRQRIVAAAMAIADAGGMGELSMRRIAADLGVATMSLYRHVPTKEDLILAMIDTAYGAEPLPSIPPAGWRARMELCARTQWTLFRRHPWLAPSMSLTRPQLAPNAIAHTEWMLDALTGTGLDIRDRIHLHIVLFSHVRGLATALEPESDAERDTGLTSEEWMDTQQPTLDALGNDHALRNFRRLTQLENLDIGLDSLFLFGLERFLDGVAVLIARTSRKVTK